MVISLKSFATLYLLYLLLLAGCNAGISDKNLLYPQKMQQSQFVMEGATYLDQIYKRC